jgi:hypothetical protein
MKIDSGLTSKPRAGLSSESIHKIQKFKAFLENPAKTQEEQAMYNMQMIKALGADTMEEAMTIIQTAGIQKDDVDELMLENMMADLQREEQMQAQPKLTRR